MSKGSQKKQNTAKQNQYAEIKARDAEKKAQEAARKKEAKKKKLRLAAMCGGAAAVLVLGFFGIRLLTLNSGSAMRKKVVAETEHFQVTAAMLACYFQQCSDSYLAYAAGDSEIAVFDKNISLRDQEYKEGTTWFDMFMNNTVKSMQNNLQLCEAAYQAGYSLDEAEKERCRTIAQQAEIENYPKGVTREDLEAATELNILADNYQQSVRNNILITDEQIQSYYDTHQAEYLNVSTLGFTFQWDQKGIVEGDLAEHDAAVAAANELAACKSQQEYSEFVFRYMTEKKDAERSDAEQIAGDLVISKLIREYPEELQEWIRGGAKPGECTMLLHEDQCNAQVYMLREEPAPDDSKTVDIRVLYLSAADYDGSDKAAAFAEELRDQVAESENPSGTFAELAYEYSEDAATYPNGGLINGYSAQRTTYGDEISAWAFDRERQPGDMTIVQRTGAVLLAYFEGGNSESGWKNSVRNDLYNQELSAFKQKYQSNAVTLNEKNYKYIRV